MSHDVRMSSRRKAAIFLKPKIFPSVCFSVVLNLYYAHNILWHRSRIKTLHELLDLYRFHLKTAALKLFGFVYLVLRGKSWMMINLCQWKSFQDD